MVKYRVAIQEYQGSSTVQFRNVMVDSRKGIDRVQADVKELFEHGKK